MMKKTIYVLYFTLGFDIQAIIDVFDSELAAKEAAKKKTLEFNEDGEYPTFCFHVAAFPLKGELP